jgi:diguanylate cyclase (GGDEF)-like protein
MYDVRYSKFDIKGYMMKAEKTDQDDTEKDTNDLERISNNLMEARSLSRIFLILALFWTIIITSLAGWSYRQAYNTALNIALSNARDTFNRDLVYRRWATSHGGVYVPITPVMQPNPYLNVPEREIATPTGKKLTLVNPAYMIRQAHELGKEQYGLSGHITSLKPIRPENAPDEWEKNALLAFERGEKEVVSIEPPDKKIFFRFMRPMLTEPACLKCHAVQGYKTGDIRGGISISVPWGPFKQGLIANQRTNIFAYGAIWIVGLIGLWFGWNRIDGDMRKRKSMEEKVHNLSITDQLTGLNNRRGFLSLAGQQLKLSSRTKSGMLLFFADLDLLKQINDTLGHEEGDKALIEAADVLKETFRTSDIIARLGGDEFAVLAINTVGVNSEVFSDRLEQLIEIRNKQEDRQYKLSISIGCSHYDPENPCSIDDLLLRADKLMYEQKQRRKENRIS